MHLGIDVKINFQKLAVLSNTNLSEWHYSYVLYYFVRVIVISSELGVTSLCFIQYVIQVILIFVRP